MRPLWRATLLLGASCGVAAWSAACSGSDPEEQTAPADPDAAHDDAQVVDAAAGEADAPLELPGVEPGEADSVGTATSRVFDVHAFEQPAATLTGAERSTWIAGQATFQLAWVATAATDRSGLGPTFNAASCEACHPRNGRGAPPLASNDPLVTSLVRLSRPAPGAGAPLGDPTYGDQLQPLAIAGVPAEGTARVTYVSVTRTYGDGTPFELLRPTLVVEPALGAFPADVQLSLRLAHQPLGMGFLEAIREEDLLAREDASDADGDGISGRANRVWDVRANAVRIGRFGWKASQPTVEQQSAAAFAGDIGITSSLFAEPGCPAPQVSCSAAAGASTEVELSDRRLDAVTMFLRGTTVPGRRDVGGAEVLRGKALFRSMACVSCHVPSYVTGTVAGADFLSQVRVWPYTDLLLHDMGQELADGRPDFAASGTEWRTPPLWGLGLLDTVSGHTRLLHDGRARGAAEAILWHGGEAAPSAERFRTASSADRHALLAFLGSL